MTIKVENLQLAVKMRKPCCFFCSFFYAATIVEQMSPNNNNTVILCLVTKTLSYTPTMVHFNATSEIHAFTSIYGLVPDVQLKHHGGILIQVFIKSFYLSIDTFIEYIVVLQRLLEKMKIMFTVRYQEVHFVCYKFHSYTI